MKPSEMASLSNSSSQNCKERPNQSTKKDGDMAETAKRYFFCLMLFVRHFTNNIFCKVLITR